MADTQTDHERYSAGRYLQMAEEGLWAPDDRVELLDGLIVSMAPQQPAHAATVWRIAGRLQQQVGKRAMVRCQLPLLAGALSVPEPDVAVVPWRDDEWQFSHPDRCLLAVEVADTSLAQDRLTKARVYAGAAVADYWVVNLKTRAVEWFCSPDPAARTWRRRGIALGSDPLPATEVGLVLTADDLFPPSPERLPRPQAPNPGR